MFKGFLLVFLVFTSVAFSQTGGESTFLILNTSTSARQIALGGKVLTLTDDVNQPIWNPASIALNLDRKLAVNYTSYIGDISIGSVSYAHRLNRHLNPFHGHITYVNYGTLIGADEDGNETSTFNASDIVMSIGYAHPVKNSHFRIGSNLKFIHSSIANFSSTGLALDLAVVYHHPKKPYTLAFVTRNIGTQITSFNGTIEKLPLELAFGVSYQLEKVPLKWHATLDNLQQWTVAVPNPSNAQTDLEGNRTQDEISFLDNAFRHLSLGAELFPKRAINLRIGYNVRRSKELQLQNVRSFGGLSFGFGLKMNKIKLNYAYSKFHTASNSSTFSLIIDLNNRPTRRLPRHY